MVPDTPHAWLTRKEASELCKKLGLQIEAVSLATYASLCEGPPYRQLGKRCCLYKHSDLVQWVKTRLDAQRRRRAANEERLRLIRRIRELRGQGLSHRAISKRLRSDGIQFSHHSVGRILRGGGQLRHHRSIKPQTRIHTEQLVA